jgi:lipoate-protein ligase A
MILIDTKTTDPAFNLAAEEYFFRQSVEDITLLYINDPSLIVGKHQNPFEEINYRYVTEKGIPVIRRLSGGGTVYHDHGNLNFTFIVNSEYGKQISFDRFIEPVTLYLKGFGVGTAVGDKHEVRTGGLKFSGNAAHVFRNRSLHHGTMLFSSQLDNLREALRRGEAGFESRSVPSNRTSVVNLESLMPDIGSTFHLKESLGRFLLDYFPGASARMINKGETDVISKLAGEKYRNREWNLGYGPSFVLRNSLVADGKEWRVSLKVEKGIIRECRVEGSADNGMLTRALTGRAYCWEEVKEGVSENKIPLEESALFRLFG